MSELVAISHEDRLFIAEGLSVLLAERVRAYHLAVDVADAHRLPRPEAWNWGIPQIEALQRRWGVEVGSDLPAHVPEPPGPSPG